MEKSESEIEILKFKVFERFSDKIIHGLSTRHGGVSTGHLESLNLGFELGDSFGNLDENYRRFVEGCGGDFERFVVANQVHGDKVEYVDETAVFGIENMKNLETSLRSGAVNGFEAEYYNIDGFITNKPGVSLIVRFADCQGAFFYDPVRGVIAAVHSGWRGNVKNILGKTVRRMVEDFGCDSENILVGVSPSLGPCCGEFSDPLKELPEFMHGFVKGRNVNLWEVSRMQLKNAGVLDKNIEIFGRCTKCENDRFFSYRGDCRNTGHMAGLICMV